MARRLGVLAILAFATGAACGGDAAVVWDDPRVLDGPIAPSASLGFGPAGEPLVTARPAPDSAALGRAVCAGSLTSVDDGAGGAFAAWWEERGDGSVVLLVSRRGRDGERAWGDPVVADGRDRGRRGCERPAPAIAADGERGHVHLAYFLEPDEGPGVWAAHSMEDGTYFHGPIVIVYGDRPVRAAVDVEGDLVVMAHEDPNSQRPRIAVAFSETAGHLIEHRFPATPSSTAGTSPLIAVDGDRIAVAWSSVEPGAAGVRLAVRLGRLTALVKRTGIDRDE